MKLPLFTGIVFVLFLTNYSIAQDIDRKYVRIVVRDANTLEKAKEIDTYMRLQNGVLTSRMDRRTGLYFAVYDANQGLSIATFKTWIEEMGYSPSCFVEGTHGNGERVKKLSRESCITESIQQTH